MKRARPNTVTDDQGRQRFHGAFTGGFSAGYFNTVGSAEGFKPAEFISSRSHRADRRMQSVQDYMDEEDGLLSGSLQTKKDLDSFTSRGQVKGGADQTGNRLINLVMEHFIVEPLNTMGKKLLQQVGWKPGHAIGPRRKVKDYFKDASVEAMVLQSAKEISFVPRIDSKHNQFVPRTIEGHYGIGYDPRSSDFIRSGSDMTSSSNRYRVDDLFKRQKRGAESNSSGRGEGRGKATVYLDDDDDIAFDHDDMDISLSVQEVHREEEDGHSGGMDDSVSAELLSARLKRCPSDDKPPLPGFLVAQRHASTFLFEHFPGPSPPVDFKSSFRHTFAVSRAELVEQVSRLSLHPEAAGKHIRLGIPPESAGARSSIGSAEEVARSQLEQQTLPPKLPSVFELLRPVDRDRLLALARQANQVEQGEVVQSVAPSPTQPVSVEGGMGRGRAATLPAWAVAQQREQQQQQQEQASTTHQLPPTSTVPKPPSLSTAGPLESRPLLVPRSLLDSGALASVSAQLQNRFTSASTASSTATALQPAPSSSAPAEAAPVPLSGVYTAEAWRQTQQQQQQLTSASTTQPVKSKPSVLTLHKARRTTVPWQPAALLCKRCRVQQPDNHTRAPVSTELDTTMAAPDPISQIIAPQKSVRDTDREKEAADVTTALSEEQRAKFQSQDVYLAPTTAKPPVSVFRSIFDADSDDEEDEDEEDGNKGEGVEQSVDRGEGGIHDREGQQQGEQMRSATEPDNTRSASAVSTVPHARAIVGAQPMISAPEATQDEDSSYHAANMVTAKFIPRTQRATHRPPRGGLVVGTKKPITTALPRFASVRDEDDDSDCGDNVQREVSKESVVKPKKRFRVYAFEDEGEERD